MGDTAKEMGKACVKGGVAGGSFPIPHPLGKAVTAVGGCLIGIGVEAYKGSDDSVASPASKPKPLENGPPTVGK